MTVEMEWMPVLHVVVVSGGVVAVVATCGLIVLYLRCSVIRKNRQMSIKVAQK